MVGRNNIYGKTPVVDFSLAICVVFSPCEALVDLTINMIKCTCTFATLHYNIT